MQIDKGRRIKLSDLFQGSPRFEAELSAIGQGLSVDFACFGLDVAGKLHSDPYMTFFNQPKTPCGAVSVNPSNIPTSTFMDFDLDRLPADVDRLVLTAAIDGAGTMSQLANGFVSIANGGQHAGKFAFTGADFTAERALMLGEFYRKDGAWRFNAIGQGFNGGLDALVQHFGGDVSAPAAPAAPAVPESVTKRLNLEKRVEREAPQLLNLVKKASVSLEKVGLGTHRAKVALVLDISGSMGGLYQRGDIQKFAERILALGCRFDDDGEIDVFLFGTRAHQPEPMNLANCTAYVRNVINIYPLEGGTNYGMVMEKIRQHYVPQNRGARDTSTPTKMELPVYAMFLTDGQTSDQSFAEAQVRAASFEPIFWQFMGIGYDGGFSFLEKLDDLKKRHIDNADFFSVRSPEQHSDDKLYDLLMKEYPGWLKMAKANGLLPA